MILYTKDWEISETRRPVLSNLNQIYKKRKRNLSKRGQKNLSRRRQKSLSTEKGHRRRRQLFRRGINTKRKNL